MIGEERVALAGKIPNAVTSAPGVYPLLNALVTGTVAGDGAAEREKSFDMGLPRTSGNHVGTAFF